MTPAWHTPPSEGSEDPNGHRHRPPRSRFGLIRLDLQPTEQWRPACAPIMLTRGATSRPSHIAFKKSLSGAEAEPNATEIRDAAREVIVAGLDALNSQSKRCLEMELVEPKEIFGLLSSHTEPSRHALRASSGASVHSDVAYDVP